MVTLLLDSTQLEVVLSPIERLLARRTASVRIAREHIAKVQLTDDAWTWLRGVRAPGTSIPGVLAIGTWKSGGGDDFVVIRRRLSGVVIDLDAGEYRRIVLSTRHAHELVQALQLEVDDEPVDVVTLATGAISLPLDEGADVDDAAEVADAADESEGDAADADDEHAAQPDDARTGESEA